MLERAARCLKTGPLQPACPLTYGVYSRRMLHSTFWRHGAGDLDVPAWCFHTMRALFEPERAKDQSKGEQCQGQLPSDVLSRNMIFLDFLYPEKTQEMIRRLSIHGLRRWHRHMRNLTKYSGLRYFASSPCQKRPAGQDTKRTMRHQQDASTIEKEVETETALRSNDEILQDLNILLRTHERGEYRESWKEAWECYTALEDDCKTPELCRRLIDLLGTSPRSLDGRRSVRLFETLPPTERSTKCFTKVILALLELKEIGKAVLLHTEGMKHQSLKAPIEGTNLLIANLIAKRQWQLVLHTYHNCATKFNGDLRAFQDWSNGLFKSVVLMPGLTGRMMHLLEALAEHPYLLSSSVDSSTRFVTGLVDSIADHGISFGTRRNLQVVQILKQLNLCPRATYERLGLLALGSQTDPAKSNKENALHIYRLYKQAVSRPSKLFLHSLVKAAVDLGDLDTVSELLPDWYKSYGTLPTTLTGLVMKGFARAGDIEKVEEFLSKYISGHKQTSWKTFYPILHVHALHADPEAVQNQTARIQVENDLIPDTTCYNILLHAYQRADDLDGALVTLSKLLEAGVEPDHYTLGTIMAVGADRGDVELCEQMLQMARDRNIRCSSAMNDCIVLAHLNNYDPSKAETIARTLTVDSRSIISTRMWNQILAYHSVDARPANLTNTLRVARLMLKLKVPYDSLSYAAIMRSYVVKRRTDMARRILHDVLLKKNKLILPIHYAIVMDGYAEQLNTEKGLRMQAEMLERGIKPNLSTKLALQKLHATAAESKLRIDRVNHPGVRLDILDESLEESLQAHDPNTVSDKSPQLQSSRFRPADIYPAAYFDLSLSFYSNVRAFDVVKTLIEKYQSQSSSAEPPLRFLATFMNLHYREGNHEEVDRYWNLAKDAALKTAKVVATYRGDKRLPPIHRKLLARHLDILLRSLDAQRDTDRPARMLAAINDLYNKGFDLDNRNWNLYVQLLATRKDYLTAFRLCERNLMASFPAWREGEPRADYWQATGQKAEGTEFLGPRYTYLKPGELRASYMTMVRFAWALRDLRRAAPFERPAKEVLDSLEREAPRTVKAAMEMPMLEHAAATHVLGLKGRMGAKRRLAA